MTFELSALISERILAKIILFRSESYYFPTFSSSKKVNPTIIIYLKKTLECMFLFTLMFDDNNW